MVSTFQKQYEISLNPKTANQVIRRAAKYVTKDTLRPALLGINFEVSATDCKIIATDAHRMYINKIGLGSSSGGPFTVILDPADLKKGLDKGFCIIRVSIGYDDTIHGPKRNYIDEATINNKTVRVIGAKYPDYAAVIPQNNDVRYTFEREPLRRVTTAAAAISATQNSDGPTAPVTFDFSTLHRRDGHSVKVSAVNIDHGIECNATIGAAYDRKQRQDFTLITFNGLVLADVLDGLECDCVDLTMSTPNRGALIYTDQADELILIMPLLRG